MALTYGFFDSDNGDRKYSATQFSSIFDGIINDGVYEQIGNKFIVTPGTGMAVKVGSGRAWLKRKWIYNSSDYSVSLDPADNNNPRIDAITLTVNLKNTERRAYFYVINGTPAASPQRPTVSNLDDIYRLVLAYVRVPAGATSISQSNITNAVGTSVTPYVTGILQVTSVDNLVAQWRNEWVPIFEHYQELIASDYNDFSGRRTIAIEDIASDVNAVTGRREDAIREIDIFLNGLKATLRDNGDLVISDFQSWMTEKQSLFTSWFTTLRNELNSNQAANLAARIEQVRQDVEDEIKFVSVEVTLPTTESVEPGGLVYYEGVPVWQLIPDYYTAKAAIWEHGSSYAYFAPTALDLKNGGAEIDLRIRNVSNATRTIGKVQLMFICKHN